MIAKLALLIVPLGLDTLAVAAALGMAGVSGREGLRASVLFSSFEAGMPLVGLAAGAPLGRAIGGDADYVAIAVLVALGLYTLLGSERTGQARLAELTQRGGAATLLLGLSISIDELAIGFTLGLLRLPTPLVIGLIALQAFVLTQLGLRVGGRLSEGLRESAERVAGLALTGLAVVLLAERMLG